MATILDQHGDHKARLLGWGARRQRASTTTTTTKDRALSRNAACGPYQATTTPAKAGPIARARLMPRLFRAIAGCSCARGTSSGTVAAQAGVFSAAPQASAKVNASSPQALIQPSAVQVASSRAISSIHSWV